MIAVFILSSLGLGFTIFYFMYKQVVAGTVQTKSQIFSHISALTLIYSLMMAAGYLLGNVLESLMILQGHWISMALFFIIGLKMYRTIIKSKTGNWTFDTTNFKVLILFSLSNSFDAFFVGIAMGIFAIYAWYFAFIFIAVMLIFVLLANTMARQKTATLAVWLFATLGSSFVGMNTFVILIWWLFFS
jgi:putative Mn2+ efflux pump MntP